MKTVVLPVSCLQPHHLVLHVTANQGIESAERLVVEQHLRVDRERAREADSLLHAARKLVRELARRVLEADELQHLRGPCVALAFRDALHLEPERDVIEDGPVREQPEVLKDHRRRVAAELQELVAGRGDHVAPVELDASGGRLDQANQRPDERRLARAGEAHDDEHLAGVHLERDVAHCGDAAGLLAQLCARQIRVGRADHLVGVPSEDLPDALRPDERRTAVSLPLEEADGLTPFVDVDVHCRRASCRSRAWSACRRRAPRSTRRPCRRGGRGRRP